MDPFIPLTINDKEILDPYLKSSGKTGSEYSFSTLYMWSGIFHTFHNIIQTENDSLLVIRSRKDENVPYHYLYPLSMRETVPPRTALIVLEKVSENRPFLLGGLSGMEVEMLESEFPETFVIEPVRDSFDYIYDINDLAHLKGKKLQSKRNHLNAFLKTYPHYEFLPVTEADIADCLVMNDEWCRIMGCIYNMGMEEEICAVHRAFRAYKSLQLEGFMIKLDGKIIAYTLGEPYKEDTYLVHVEKAFPEFRGAYQVINQLLVKYVMENYPGVKYINREDDAGDKGLRHAKMSYRPVLLLEKYMTKITPPAIP
ncbi:MAG: phosphatidylglycerol lysyltransferase domain-containing protein [Bacteroidales bacterium]|jgi:hypothetical protein